MYCQHASTWLSHQSYTHSLSSVAVTGANTGIGFAICWGLGLLQIPHVLVCARNHQKGQQAVNRLQHAHPNTHFTFHPLDLTDRASIDIGLSTILQIPIDALVHNAGIANDPYRMPINSQGIAQTFFTNAIAPWYITGQCIKHQPHLQRVVSISSLARALASDNRHLACNYTQKQIVKHDNHTHLTYSKAYIDSKWCNVLFHHGLQRYAQRTAKPVRSALCHPGLVFTQMNAACNHQTSLTLIHQKQWASLAMKLAGKIQLCQKDALWSALSPIHALLSHPMDHTETVPSGVWQLCGTPKRIRLHYKQLDEQAQNMWYAFKQRYPGLYE